MSDVYKCKLKLNHTEQKPSISSIQKRRRLLWGPSWFEMDRRKVEMCAVVWWDHISNHAHHVLQAKEDKDLPDCDQHIVQKPASVMVWKGGGEGRGGMHTECLGKERWCNTVVNKLLSQLYWNVLRESNSKWVNVCKKTIKFIRWNMKYLVYVGSEIEFRLRRICKSYSGFIYILRNVPTSLELGSVQIGGANVLCSYDWIWEIFGTVTDCMSKRL